MRQWNLNPKMLCSKHLLGEHHELHYAAGYIRKHNPAIRHWTERNFLELKSLKKRHIELVIEMRRRNYNHYSPLPNLSLLKTWKINMGKIDIEYNFNDLMNRCSSCREQYTKMKGGE